MTGIYNDFFRFPTLQYVLSPAIVVEGSAISLCAGAIGAMGAVVRAVRLPAAEAMRPAPPPRHRLTWFDRVVPRRYVPPPVKMMIRNLSRQPLRAGFSVLGVAFSAGLLVVGMFSVDAVEQILDWQYNVAHRQDYTITFVEPRSTRALGELAHLPGVLAVEPIRLVPARLRAGHRMRQEAITGVGGGSRLQRIMDKSLKPVALPQDGLVLSSTLADILDVGPGQLLQVELLEGSRPVRNLVVADVIDEWIGTSVYMDMEALHRLLREGPRVSGAALMIDKGDPREFYERLKLLPAVAGVTSKRAAIENFRTTLAHNMGVMTFFNVLFSSVIAFGVIYNAARISLSERSRELASLRVLGFTRAEISSILLGELGVVVVIGVPAGLILGYGLAALLVQAFDTELFRIPLVVSARTFGFAAATTFVAAVLSGLAVRRRIDRLDLVAVLKTRE
jgi:putative ABC transport system permease protein